MDYMFTFCLWQLPPKLHPCTSATNWDDPFLLWRAIDLASYKIYRDDICKCVFQQLFYQRKRNRVVLDEFP